MHEFDRLRHLAGLCDDHAATPPDWIRPQLEATGLMVRPLDGGRIPPIPIGRGASTPRSWQGRWREVRAFLYLDGEGRADPGVPFAFSGLHALSTAVVIRSLSPSALAVLATCDGPLRLGQPGFIAERPAGQPVAFTVAPRERDRTALELPPATTSCGLVIRAGRRPGERRLRPEREELGAAVAAADGRLDLCMMSDAARLDPHGATFAAPRWLSRTCSMSLGAARLPSDSRDGFNARAEALLGAPLPPACSRPATPRCRSTSRARPGSTGSTCPVSTSRRTSRAR